MDSSPTLTKLRKSSHMNTSLKKIEQSVIKMQPNLNMPVVNSLTVEKQLQNLQVELTKVPKTKEDAKVEQKVLEAMDFDVFPIA